MAYKSKYKGSEVDAALDKIVAGYSKDLVDLLFTNVNTSISTNVQTLNNKIDTNVQTLNGTIGTVDNKIGTLTSLKTTEKSDIVKAINENYDYMHSASMFVYGVSHAYNNASPILTRVGNLELHKSLPVQSLMRRCLLNDDGEVVTYLDDNDSTKTVLGNDAVLDGSQGLVMVEIPEHYRKFTITDSTYTCEISLMPFNGAHKVNKCYISAYEAALDRENNKLSSVVNITTNYRGGNNTSAWDDTYRTLLGRPVTNVSLTSFRSYANNRGNLWKCQEWDIYCAVYWLYTIEYANLNCQSTYNANLTTEGYKQGGLGSGVTSISDWSGYNSYNPMIPCGATNSLGNKTGVSTYNVIASDGSSTYYAAPVPSYRGVENPFGHIWKWTDGVLALGNGTTQDYYKCSLRSKYGSSITSDYIKVGTSPISAGYKKSILRTKEGDLFTKEIGGGDTTYFCDYHNQAVANGTTYGFLLGGSAPVGSSAGFGCAYSYRTPANAHADVGSRLCYCKENKIIN